MNILNKFHKTKYIISLFLIVSVLLSICVLGEVKLSEKCDFGANESLCFGEVCSILTFNSLCGRFEKNEFANTLRRKSHSLRKVCASTHNISLKCHAGNAEKVVFYVEICCVTALIVIIYIFLSDGRKRNSFVQKLKFI